MGIPTYGAFNKFVLIAIMGSNFRVLINDKYSWIGNSYALRLQKP